MNSCIRRGESSAFFGVEDSHIVKAGKPMRFIGTNVWYASDIAVSDHDRLTTGLDSLKALGLTNIRVCATEDGLLAGCNFWSWSGVARQTHEIWQEGDDLCGDPSQEAQGLSGVYLSDRSAVDLIREHAGRLEKATE